MHKNLNPALFKVFLPCVVVTSPDRMIEGILFWAWVSVILSLCHYVTKSFCHSVILSQNFNLGHNICNIEDSNLIFGMHVYLMELHILSGERSRSMSSFKVKGNIYGDMVFHKHIACYKYFQIKLR